jgi:sugar lactone lactonase YvrE
MTTVRTSTLVALALALAPAACMRPADARDRNEDETATPVGSVVDLYGPESARYDPDQDAFLISNMLGYGSAKDGAGYILRVSAGDITRVDTLVLSGRAGARLDAPKGIALQGDTLWVTDIDVLRGFDRRTGAPYATIDFRPYGAVLLNDVAASPDGTLRVTDTGLRMDKAGAYHVGGDKIFDVGPGHSVRVVEASPALDQPNGVTWDARGRRWLVVTFDPWASQVYSMRPASTTRTVVARGKGQFDGVEALADGSILVSSWADSSIHVFADSSDQRVVRYLSEPADIGVDTRRNRVAVPLPIAGRVELWELPKRR